MIPHAYFLKESIIFLYSGMALSDVISVNILKSITAPTPIDDIGPFPVYLLTILIQEDKPK